MTLNNIFFNILNKSGLDVNLAMNDGGVEPVKIVDNVAVPYEFTDNWCTYYIKLVDSYVNSDGMTTESRNYYKIIINVIGENADYYSSILNLIMSSEETYQYLSNNNIGITKPSSMATESNYLYGEKWFKRRILSYNFNSISSITDDINYIENIGKLNIKEV